MGDISRPLLIAAVISLLVALILLFCEIVYSVGPEKIQSYKIVGLARQEVPVNICAALTQLEKEEMEATLVAQRLNKRYRRSLHKARSRSRERPSIHK
jgi:hypothetical protein